MNADEIKIVKTALTAIVTAQQTGKWRFAADAELALRQLLKPTVQEQLSRTVPDVSQGTDNPGDGGDW